MRQLLLALLLLVPAVAWGQNTNTVPPACAVADLGTCVPAIQGTTVRITDGDDTNNDCTGGGSTVRTCEYNGSSWVPVTAGTWSGANGENIVNSVDGTFDFTRDESGTVTLTASDDDATAALSVLPGGAAAMTIGGASTTALTVNTDGLDVGYDLAFNTLSLRSSDGGNTGPVILDFRDYAATDDDDMSHIIMDGNCTTTTTGAEDCDLTVQATEAGAAITRFVIDGDGHNIFAPEPTDGGNGNLQHKIVGIPKIAGFSVGTGNDGSETTNVDFGDSETPDTDWTQTANITTSDDTTIFRKGTASLKMVIGATPSDGNGADNTLGTGNQDWSADESFGLWHRCDTTYSAGDWVLEITDSVAGATEVNFPAYGTADTWVWTEIDISGVADTSKDVITDLAIDLSAAGATTFAAGGNCWFDYMWKWDAAEELALTADIYEDGILSMFSVITAGASITPILEVEGTDFFVHYESGNDFIVPVTDLSADSLWGMAALE